MITIVALGDSTTAGTPGYKSPVEAPPNGSGNVESQYAYWLMRARPDWQVLNRGVNGERSDQIGARFECDQLSRAGGHRDHRRGQRHLPGPERRIGRDELEKMNDAARALQAIVVAGTIIPFNTATPDQNARMHAVNDWIRAYAANHGNSLVYCDTRAAAAAPGQPDRLVSSPDDLHPSPDGYRRMAIALESAIDEATVKAGRRLPPGRGNAPLDPPLQ